MDNKDIHRAEPIACIKRVMDAKLRRGGCFTAQRLISTAHRDDTEGSGTLSVRSLELPGVNLASKPQ